MDMNYVIKDYEDEKSMATALCVIVSIIDIIATIIATYVIFQNSSNTSNFLKTFADNGGVSVIVGGILSLLVIVVVHGILKAIFDHVVVSAYKASILEEINETLKANSNEDKNE